MTEDVNGERILHLRDCEYKNGTVNAMISIANNKPTNEKVSTTRTFAHECTELLKMSSECTLSFDKFMQVYLHHFGRQCRLADY